MASPEDIAYARDLTNQLRALNELAAAVDHQCTPRWWPHHIGEHWECEHGHGWHVAYARDICQCDSLGIKPDELGWQSDE